MTQLEVVQRQLSDGWRFGFQCWPDADAGGFAALATVFNDFHRVHARGFGVGRDIGTAWVNAVEDVAEQLRLGGGESELAEASMAPKRDDLVGAVDKRWDAARQRRAWRRGVADGKAGQHPAP